MNQLSYYERTKLPYSEEETQQLKKEYEVDSLDILQCANIHKRTPGSIAFKLKIMGIVVNHQLARGYKEYKTSDLYDEVVIANVKKDVDKQLKKREKETLKEEKTFAPNEILKIKEDIMELKKDVKEILRLINLVYEFEQDNDE
jgi:hypothetical protein